MKAGQYLEELQADFEAQGLGSTGRVNLLSAPNWHGLRDILAPTRLVGHESHRVATKKNLHPATEIGEMTLRYAQDKKSVPFSAGIGYTCCTGAKARLIRTTSYEHVHKAQYVSPVVVVRNDQSLAIIKGFEQRTSYGLDTDLPHGIVTGVFSEPPPGVLQRMRTNTRPFYLDIDQHGMATPLRIGGFLVPNPKMTS